MYDPQFIEVIYFHEIMENVGIFLKYTAFVTCKKHLQLVKSKHFKNA
jgi:hypothetical protein